MSDSRFKLILERFNPTPCFDWESQVFAEEGQSLIEQVEKIKPLLTEKQSYSFEDWLKSLSEDELLENEE